jgi:hypothetical protein
MKMTHKEVGIHRRYFFHKECVFKEKLRCDTLDIRIQNLVHKEELCMIQKRNKKIPCIDSKKTSLMGHFLWDMRSRPKM